MKRITTGLVVAGMLALASHAGAQEIDLAAGGADSIWHGSAKSHAGVSLDIGALSAGDSRRDLIIGAPGEPGVTGKVYVIFGGPVRSGSQSLDTTADTIVSSTVTGDLFGKSTAAGNVISLESSAFRDLVVGAPAAFGGRGAVYVFRGGFANGARLTTASAVLTVIGKPGDGLGSALATADLNKDGYREIIMGARQSGHIYAIRGGTSLSGTWDLASKPADITIFGTGIGNVMAAGDVNGDGVQDLLIGSPSQNQAYLLYTVGGGTYPKDIAMPGAADSIFTGRNPGDQAGAAIKLADVDGDGKSDVVIGAPGGHGPIDRPNAGEVYILWGGHGIASRSLQNADVTFYGAGVNFLSGTFLTSGDVNRDTPNDLAILAPGSSDGGQLHVYYGRDRATIGAVGPDGRRTVDLSVSGQVDRRIFGDPSAGAMQSAVVYEVTGEGARDLIVGVPDANSAEGAVYFTTSPKLSLSPASLAITAAQGATGSAALTVGNQSIVGITWAATTSTPWLSLSPSSGSANNTSSATVTVSASTVGKAVGTYTGTLNVRSTSRDLEMQIDVPVTLTVTAGTGGGGGGTPAPTNSSDFDGDGHNDLIWQHDPDGTLAVWRMNGINQLSVATLNPSTQTGPGWTVAGVADMNRDGHVDIIWYNTLDGRIEVWYMNGYNRIAVAPMNPDRRVDTNWRVQAFADMNGDGNYDIIWRNMTTGVLECWLMNGVNLIDSVYMNPDRITDPNWKIIGAIDVNHDGKPDMIWYNQVDGWMIAILMDGTKMITSAYMDPDRVTVKDWDFAAFTDINGDGKVDMIWRHKTEGWVIGVLLDGLKMLDSVYLNPMRVSDTNWRLIGPR